MPALMIFSQRNSFVKDILKIKLEPWMHIGFIELDNDKFGYAIWVWDSREVINEGELSKELEDKIKFYITDHFLTNEVDTNDNYLPLKDGSYISKDISKYFDKHYDTLVNGVETLINSSYEDVINKLSETPDKAELVKSIKSIMRTSTHEQRCISMDNFKDGFKIRCNGGRDVAIMVNNKLIKAGLKTDLPNNSRYITVYF